MNNSTWFSNKLRGRGVIYFIRPLILTSKARKPFDKLRVPRRCPERSRGRSREILRPPLLSCKSKKRGPPWPAFRESQGGQDEPLGKKNSPGTKLIGRTEKPGALLTSEVRRAPGFNFQHELLFNTSRNSRKILSSCRSRPCRTWPHRARP